MSETDYFNLTLLRQQRDQLLINSDKYVLQDFPITPENLELIKEYRQQLRNFMNLEAIKNYNSGNNISFPTFPF